MNYRGREEEGERKIVYVCEYDYEAKENAVSCIIGSAPKDQNYLKL